MYLLVANIRLFDSESSWNSESSSPPERHSATVPRQPDLVGIHPMEFCWDPLAWIMTMLMKSRASNVSKPEEAAIFYLLFSLKRRKGVCFVCVFSFFLWVLVW